MVDELRILFANIDEQPDSNKIGLYPFESFKKIGKTVGEIGCDRELSPDKIKEKRMYIVDQWKKTRRHYLSEIDRRPPRNPDT